MLRIGSIPVVSSYGIGERLAEFQNRYHESQIDFDMHEGNQYDVIRELNNGVKMSPFFPSPGGFKKLSADGYGGVGKADL